MKRALITGITGQDGAYLAKFLLEKGYKVFGIYRRLSSPNFWRLQYLDVFDKVDLITADLLDSSSIFEAIRVAKPDEIYHLAAQSFVGASFEQAVGTGEITGLGVARILEAIRVLDKNIRFYQASTSELYGNGSTEPQNEETKFNPTSPYASAKLYGFWLTKIYREAYGIFACNGILFNHESPLRGLEFVTRKITNAVGKIALGFEKELVLGNLEAKRDWGFAPEYVESMWLMLQHKQPDDYVIATNETHTVRELVQYSFELADLDWRDYVRVDERFLRPLDVNYLQGDFRKAEKVLGWTPKTKFHDLVKIMVEEEINRWRKWSRGERFPWDAQNYPNENRILSPVAYLER
ncbi:GDP-mannose 4,6-dehydratase [Pelotomaculum propionicicum]|uniref:GDP-mannose 4,6-dehydratase n=1 Tax=Pelotomaculum propionicicum TaxID=258475 RepID=A0A4Y7RQE9_9FIRM|nr:GDP-mannose 4,6-dehydratase [Pelotomaculum propionicicum]TEB11061.1 GDP-mannose 4,6-dehydratase [Pelotomaculum propionicicum]